MNFGIGSYIASMLGVPQSDHQFRGITLGLFGLLYGYVGYKLFEFAEKEKQRERVKEKEIE